MINGSDRYWGFRNDRRTKMSIYREQCICWLFTIPCTFIYGAGFQEEWTFNVYFRTCKTVERSGGSYSASRGTNYENYTLKKLEGKRWKYMQVLCIRGFFCKKRQDVLEIEVTSPNVHSLNILKYNATSYTYTIHYMSSFKSTFLVGSTSR